MPEVRANGVAIGLGLYNGVPFIDAQLESIAAQDHQNWALIVSDDGSTDTGPERVHRFANGPGKGRVTLTRGPRLGFAQNYLTLLQHPIARQSDHVALCDQDDEWLTTRLSRGVAALRGFGDSPALYCARTVVCNVDLRPLHLSPLWPRPFSMRNALVQNVASGNTLMLNRAMADIAADAAPAAQMADIAAHDWWLYLLACATGAKIVQDNEPVVHYRQHDRNTMGRNDTASARLGRITRIIDGTFARWIDANCRSMAAVPHLLTPDAAALLSQFPKLRAKNLKSRLAAHQDMGLYRQGKMGDLAIKAAVISGRL
ncbi:MAG: glycosyltransferase [Paracoccaceae bacterium]